METFTRLLAKAALGNGVSSTCYDTAWVARLGQIDAELGDLAVDWLCEHQLPDGSWGAEYPFCYEDRLLSTLAAVVSLTSTRHRRTCAVQVQKGLLALKNLTSPAREGPRLDIRDATVGFELIAPTLMAEAQRLGLTVRRGESILGELASVREKKLGKLAGKKISRHLTAAFSVELAGQDKLQMLDVDNLQETDGSVKYSPSASAYFALYVKPRDERALAYISSIVQARRGGAPAMYRAEIFEILWCLWNLSITDIDLSDPEVGLACKPYLDYVEQRWIPGRGLGWTANSILVDCDSTSVAYEVLSKFGRSPDLETILQYEEADWFRTYSHEVGPSVSTNIHVLGALKRAGYDKCHPRVRKVLSFIRSSKDHGRWCWRDKWHRSAYYATAHLVIATSNYDDDLCSGAIGWILDTQRSDGSWGFFDGAATAEETAYCIQALVCWQRLSGTSFAAQINRAGAWLSQNREPPYPPLWTAKTLFCVETVVRAGILSALRLVEESNRCGFG
ncbi:prenyltransferase/squalene oxidase repeat-containing protein [Mycobacterium decipiens]|uniref:Cyclase n=1 Tax=Mycobacterium decipiens TaxID=1430326 RepID=A0A1X2LY95_9MYCO|nr:prenyltransferase/squalene oxidase repeat-containing protein [Mycobacterium decipiens]OSC42086.1 cyclase [Mycobacterium decipiens]